MSTQTTTPTNGLTLNTLRRLALMQHLGEDFFILDGIAYEGDINEATQDFETDNKENDSIKFADYCANNFTEVNELEADDDSENYMVLTDEEADEKAKLYIEDSLWAFNAEFIIGECGLDFTGVDSLRKMQQDTCEGANDFIRSLIDRCTDINSFVESAIIADGRGHFMSSYDGNEKEETVNGITCEETGEDSTTFYIYRTN